MTRRTASPFDGLLGVKRKRLPGSAGVTVVVAGKPVRDVREIDRRLVDGERTDQEVVEARKVRAQVESARNRAQFVRQCIEGTNKRDEWNKTHPEERRKYQARWRERNREHLRAYSAEWARQKYRADPEPSRQAQRRYYEANREAILERGRQLRAAKREAALRAQQQGKDGES